MSALTPEQLAREEIDRLLIAAGWVIQNKDEFNRNAAEGVAAESVENLQAALEAFQAVAEELN